MFLVYMYGEHGQKEGLGSVRQSTPGNLAQFCNRRNRSSIFQVITKIFGKKWKNNDFHYYHVFVSFLKVLGRFQGLREAPKYHTDTSGHSRGRIDFTKHRKNSIYMFWGMSMYEKWTSKTTILSRASIEHLYYLFFNISKRFFPNAFFKFGNLKICKSPKNGNFEILSLTLWNL